MNASNNIETLERYKSVLKCHAKSYRKKIVVEKPLLLKKYKGLLALHKSRNETYKVLLGDFRHDTEICNYNELVEQVEKKWSERDKVLERDIIHSVSNKCNDIILGILINKD